MKEKITLTVIVVAAWVLAFAHPYVSWHKRQKSAAVRHGFRSANFSFFLGKSDAIQQTIAITKWLSPSKAAALIPGEMAFGNEVFAKAIHGESKFTKSELRGA